MSKTFTLFKNIAAPKGQSRHDIYTVPVGRSAIVDIRITPTYTSSSSGSGGGSSGGSNVIAIYISVVIRKQGSGSGSIGNDNFTSSNLLKLDGCILESGDTLSISVNSIGVEDLNIAVAIGGILQ